MRDRPREPRSGREVSVKKLPGAQVLSGRAMAALVLAGWTPVKWAPLERRTRAPLIMAPPETLVSVSAKERRKALFKVVREAVQWEVEYEYSEYIGGHLRKKIRFIETPWSEEAQRAYGEIEAKLGSRPTA